MKPDFRQLYAREKQVLHIIMKVEERGLAFDAPKARKEALKLKRRMRRCESAVQKYLRVRTEHLLTPQPEKIGYAPNIVNALRRLGITDKQMALKGKVTTEADVLRRILNEEPSEKVKDLIENLLEYRAYKKTVSTYLEPLAARAEMNNGIVYTSINPTDTRTGRMASREPNLQNIPTLTPRRGRTAGGKNPVRSCFVCRPGFANYYFDYSQMEIAVFGLYADEPLILDTYKSGGDIHGVMAETLYGSDYSEQERNRTKDTNYGIIYGMGLRGMAQYRAVSEKEAREFLRFYHESFPTISEFLEECKQRLKSDGYVEDWFGRRYSIPYGNAYKAINALVQGACAQIFKIALICLDEYLDRSFANIILPVHDEFQIEKREQTGFQRTFCSHVIQRMVEIEELIDRDLKLRVDVSKTTTSWAEKKKLET
jgi:DNA polymerase-1